jgi:nucleotide-binding universal stress UspA family protein
MASTVQSKIGFARILVATDFTDASQRAMDYASSIAKAHDSEMLVTHVSPQDNPILPPEASWFAEVTEPTRIHEKLEDLGAELRSEGLKARTLSLTGNPSDEIVLSAVREGCDLIVAGTHSRTGFERLIFGSDAEALMRDAYCPVLIVGPHVSPASSDAWSPKRVIYAGTLEPQSALVAAYASALADEHKASLTIFHAHSTAHSRRAREVRSFEDALSQLLPGKRIPHYALHPPVDSGKLGSAIVEYAKAKNFDLIVMGAKPGSFETPHFLRGIAAQVTANATCPVLFVHNH